MKRRYSLAAILASQGHCERSTCNAPEVICKASANQDGRCTSGSLRYYHKIHVERYKVTGDKERGGLRDTTVPGDGAEAR